MQKVVAAYAGRLSNPTTWASGFMPFPKGQGYETVVELRAANRQVELVLWSIPDLEAMSSRLREVTVPCSKENRCRATGRFTWFRPSRIYLRFWLGPEGTRPPGSYR